MKLPLRLSSIIRDQALAVIAASLTNSAVLSDRADILAGKGSGCLRLC